MKEFVLVSVENDEKQKKQYEDLNIYVGKAVLLALFHQKKLTQWQFDRCMELLHKQTV